MKTSIVAALLLVVAAAPASAGQLLSGSAGGRSYKLYVPSSGGGARPLVVMLHGCTQSPDQFIAATRMNDLAERDGFLVVYPEQPASAQGLQCWQWWDPAHQSRGAGEPASIVAIVDDVAAMRSVDSLHVYVAGLSAGAAMAVILGATYPDRFAAIAVGAGLEYRAATTLFGGSQASLGGGPDPVAAGDAAYQAMGTHRRAVRVIVFQGTADYTVAPLNADQVIAQWARTDDLASDGVADGNVRSTPDTSEAGQVSGGHSYTHDTHRDRSTGRAMLERYTIAGMGHAWSGGASGASYTDPMGPDATTLAWAFFSTGSSTTNPGAPGAAGAPTGGCSVAGVTSSAAGTSASTAASTRGLGLALSFIALALTLRSRRRRPSLRA